MLKKSLAFVLCISLLILGGCGTKKKTEKKVKKDTASSSSEAPSMPDTPAAYNNLTGLGIDPDKATLRPVAVMINNMDIAQPVQTGVNKADIVYETEVEGGITRLMAVFKDVSTVNQLGPIRSARYCYVDLARGHNAVYYHCGQDPTYCKPHLSVVDDISIDSGTCGGTRIKNGLSKEHTLYSYGNKLSSGVSEKGITPTQTNNENWQSFAGTDEKITLTGGICNTVTVPFSSSYKTAFKYDSAKEKYIRYSGAAVRKDYVTGETTDVKNVFVLLTSISNYSDGKHRNVGLDGGKGYYFVNGTYQEINWSKGYSANSIKFTDASGAPLKVNAGNSWVCIANRSTSSPVIE